MHQPCFASPTPHKSVHALFLKLWENLHQLVPEEPTRSVPKTKQTVSICRALRCCLCTRPDLRNFRAAFIATAKQWYKKGDRNNLKPVFEDGFGVICLEWFPVDADFANDQPSEINWYNLPYSNQRSWAIATLELFYDEDIENRNVARAFGHIALRAAPAMHRPRDDIFNTWGISAVPRTFQDKDLR
jgi:hypothetical protein